MKEKNIYLEIKYSLNGEQDEPIRDIKDGKIDVHGLHEPEMYSVLCYMLCELQKKTPFDIDNFIKILYDMKKDGLFD